MLFWFLLQCLIVDGTSYMFLLNVIFYFILLNVCWTSSRRRTSKHAKILLCRPSGERLNTHSDLCKVLSEDLSTRHSWRAIVAADVYTRNRFSDSMGVTVGWPRTNGTANNERVHSFCWFLPNPFIEDLFFWRSRQGFVKTDFYPLISVRYAVCSTRRWSTCRPLLRAC